MVNMGKDKKTLLSGVKPTGRPHIGNYFGAMKQFVDMQEVYRPFIFIANYHALTGTTNKERLEQNTIEMVLDYLAIGLNPDKSTIFLQSDVPEVTELAWIFNCITTMPYLMRAHAFKDARDKDKEVNVGTFDYPVLMAADILIYDANAVPVGQDQKQHLEMARDIAKKFNNIYGDTFNIPEPIIKDDVSIVPGTDGRKMSKSYGNTIPLFGSDEEIKKAVMSIVTDSKSPEDVKNPNECNIFSLHKLFSNDEELADIEKRYKDGGIGYKESKDTLLKNILSLISPMRKRREELKENMEQTLHMLKNGGEIARSTAKAKMIDVREKVGLSVS